MNSSVSFHRAFTTPSLSAPFLYINTNPNSRLINDGYVLGLDQGGDSGSGMWEDNGPSDQDLNLWDWSLTGVTQTGGNATFYSSGGYGFLQSYSAGLWSTAYPHAVLTWNANSGAGATAVDGSGTWNLTTANFTDGTNYAFNGPERTEQATFGAGSGTAGTVTLGATVPVDQIIFNAAGSGTYTIASSGANVIALGAGSIITTNVNAAISANMTGGTSSQHGAVFQLIKNGNATLTLTGTTTLLSGVAFHARAGTTVIDSGGNFNSGFYTFVALYSNESAILTVKGSGVFNGPGQDFNLGDLGGTGVLNVQDSAAVNVGQLYVGKGSIGSTGAGGTGTVNQTGGAIAASGFVSLGSVNAASIGTYKLSGGVLRTAAVQGAGQSAFNFNGGTLQASAASANFLSGLTHAVVGTGGAVIDTGGYNVVVSQILSGGAGDGGLSKLGAGSMAMTGSSSYTGSTTVSAGTLQVGAGGATGSLPATGAIVDNATLAFKRSNTITQSAGFGATISGSGAVAQLGSGTLNLAGTNSYTGGTQVLAGTLLLTGSLNPSGRLGIGGPGAPGFVYAHAPAATQTINGLTIYAGYATISNTSAGTLALGPITRNAGGIVDFPASGGVITTTASNSSDILGPWALVGSGASTLYAYSNSGTVTGYNGAVVESGSDVFGGIPAGDTSTVNYNVTSPGTFAAMSSSLSVNTINYSGGGATQPAANNTSLTVNGIMNTGTGPLTIGGSPRIDVTIGSDQDLVVATMTGGIIINNNISDNSSGASALTKVGSGLLTLSGVNGYTGGTSISGGTLQLGNGGAGGSLATASSIIDNGTLAFSRSNNVSQGTGFSSAAISGGGGIAKFGAGNLTLNALNSIAGNVTVSGGTLTVGSASQYNVAATGSGLGDPSIAGRTVTINNGGVLAWGAGNQLGGPQTGEQPILSFVINQGGSMVGYNGDMNTIGNLSLNGGTLTTNTGYAGDAGGTQSFYISGGSVQVGGTSRSVIAAGGGSYNGINLAGTTTFNVAATGGAAPDLAVSAALADRPLHDPGTAALVKTGAGVMQLNAINTYTGGTTVSGGTLSLNNGGGSGTIRGPLAINSGAMVNLTAGDAIGYNSGACVTTVSISGATLNNGVSAHSSYATNYVLTGGSITSSGGGQYDFTTGYGITTNASNTTSVITAPIDIRDADNLTFNVAAGGTPGGVDLVDSGAIENGRFSPSVNAITKTGPGLMRLTGSNTYTGGTTISGGTLEVGAGGNTGTLGTAASSIRRSWSSHAAIITP